MTFLPWEAEIIGAANSRGCDSDTKQINHPKSLISFDTYGWGHVKNKTKLRRRIQSELISASQHHGPDIQFHSFSVGWNNVRIFLQSKLNASHEQFKARLWQRHLGSTIAEAMEVSVGTKDNGIPVLVAVTLEAFPDGRSVVEGAACRSEGEIRLGEIDDGIKNASRIRRQVIVVLRPFSGGRRQVNVRMFLGMVQIPWQRLKVNALLGRFDFFDVIG